MGGLGISGLSVLVGIAAFFILSGKKPGSESGLDFKAMKPQLSHPTLWIWILLPVAANLLSFGIAYVWLPGFISHVAERTEQLLTFDKILLLSVQLMGMALGEELAWRAFFQKRLGEHIPACLAIVLTSLLFSLGHFSSGSALIVAYDLLFVFINSFFYGIVFQKTNNAWISAVSHLIANGAAMALLFFVR